MTTRIKLMLLVAAMLILSACSPSFSHGGRRSRSETYRADYNEVWAAMIKALAGLGLDIEYADKISGVIETEAEQQGGFIKTRAVRTLPGVDLLMVREDEHRTRISLTVRIEHIPMLRVAAASEDAMARVVFDRIAEDLVAGV